MSLAFSRRLVAAPNARHNHRILNIFANTKSAAVSAIGTRCISITTANSPICLHSSSSRVCANNNISGRFFSEKPIIPGIGKGKTSTGIVGLDVDHDAVNKIISFNQALLDKMEASDMPESAQYRINVSKLARYRIKMCLENADDPEQVEELCQMGQVEELVEQAKDEMEVLDMYLRERMWEMIKPVKIEYNPTRDQTDEDDDEEGESK